MIRNEYKSLVASAPDPRTYTCKLTYFTDAVIGSVFKKYKDFDLGVDLVANAEKSFLENEFKCYASNERLAPYARPDGPADGELVEFINLVRKEVRSVLRCVPSNLKGKFGPGSTYGDVGSLTTLPDKMSTRPTLTRDADIFLPIWEESAWARFGSNRLAVFPGTRRSPEVVRGNRFTTVDKDAQKRRGICIEPSINLFYQLGIGGEIRRRLKDSGVDLVEGQEYHRMLAREGSMWGNLATIDLSNASDTISKKLVELLLPPDWYQLLVAARSPFTFINGRWVLLEKFSSMGNGYTFELETLIFLCIARAVQKSIPVWYSPRLHGHVISVYGDDIIVPTAIASKVISALNFFGLSTNKDKTFIYGEFRESCGGDYFDGMDVRPHFLNESPVEPQQFIALANGLNRLIVSWRSNTSDICPFLRAHRRVLDALPSDLRNCKGPQVLGDIVIHESEVERWRIRERNGIRYIRCYRPIRPKAIGWEYFYPGVVLASALYGASDGTETNREDPTSVRWTVAGVFPRQHDLLSHKQSWVAFS